MKRLFVSIVSSRNCEIFKKKFDIKKYYNRNRIDSVLSKIIEEISNNKQSNKEKKND